VAEIVLPEMPDISGISCRSWSNDADYPLAVELLNLEMRSMGVDNLVAVEEIRNVWDNTPHLELCRDAAFVEIDAVPVGFVLVRWHDEADGSRVYRHQCCTHPDWRGRGIGTGMLEWAIAHIRDIAAGHDVDRKVLRASVSRLPAPAADLLESFGYEASDHFAELIRVNLDGIPDAPLPSGVEIRPVEQTHLRRIFDADCEAFRGHWGYREDSDSEEDWRWFLEFPHRDESLWKVAWMGDNVVGQVRGFINRAENREMNRRRGWCDEISTLPEYRRQGIATALICATLREFKARGMTEAALDVHVENPNMALRLYTSLGFELHSQGATYERGFE